MKNRLTEKKLLVEKFRLAEERILLEFFAIRDRISILELTKGAEISRSAFYRHHSSLYKIVSECEDAILKVYKRDISELLENDSIKIDWIYLKVLAFMMSQRGILGILVQNGETKIIKLMIEVVELEILERKNLVGDNIFKVYGKEIEGIIEIWGQKGFDRNEMEGIFTKIMFLTNSLEKRLKPLENFQ